MGTMVDYDQTVKLSWKGNESPGPAPRASPPTSTPCTSGPTSKHSGTQLVAAATVCAGGGAETRPTDDVHHRHSNIARLATRGDPGIH